MGDISGQSPVGQRQGSAHAALEAGPKKCVFTDEDLEAVSCESSWRHKAESTVSTSCQTSDVRTYDFSCTATEQADAESQTLSIQPSDGHLANVDDPDFLNCLQIMARRMIVEIVKNNHSHAFDGYEPSWHDQHGSVSCYLTLNVVESKRQEGMAVTSLSWNATGSVVGATFGELDHDAWCSHKSQICFWNIDRHDGVAERPDETFDVDNCAMCLAFHPVLPGLFAAGTFSGDLLVWDTARGTESAQSSSVKQDAHGDPVCQIKWLGDSHKAMNLVTVSSGGQFVIWKVLQHKNLQLVPEQSVSLAQNLIHSARLKSYKKGVAVTSVAFDPEDSGSFLIGTENGDVMKYSRYQIGNDELPMSFHFRSHSGPVYALDFSRFKRNTFLSGSTDCCIHIHSTLEENPLASVEPCEGYLYACRWSHTHPSVIAFGASSGKLVFYNLKWSHVNPCHTIECNAKASPVYSVEFNPVQSALLATGDGHGMVKVWRLGSDLTTSEMSNNDDFTDLIR